MKKTLIIIIAIIIALTSIAIVIVKKAENQGNNLMNFNKYYESFLDKEIFGSDVATLINKAIDNNEKNNVSKDEKNIYLDNGVNSIKIYIRLLEADKDYEMEVISGVGMTEFISNYNTLEFKCTKITYHESTGRVATLLIEEI